MAHLSLGSLWCLTGSDGSNLFLPGSRPARDIGRAAMREGSRSLSTALALALGVVA